MATNTQAIHPTFINEVRETLEEPGEQPLALREERALADLSETAGWTILRKHIMDIQSGLEALVSSALTQGATYEEIGQKTIIAQLAKESLTKVIEKVEDAKAAIESEPGK